MSDGIDGRELDKLQKAIDNLLGPQMVKFKERVPYFVSVAIKKVIQPYKGPTHSPVIWASEKERRWYFAARRDAGLPPKYTRGSDAWSQNLQKNWRITRRKTESVLGNPSSYGPWVVSDEYQTAQHAATGFTTDKQAVEKVIEDGTVRRIVEAHVNAIVREAFRGL